MKPDQRKVAGLPPFPKLSHIGLSWLGALIAISTIAFLGVTFESPLLMAPLGASAVLAFGVPDSPLAQPRNIVGGHILSASTGFLFLFLFGSHWWVMGMAVATAIVFMQLTRSVHPPAGANPLIVISTCASWNYLLLPVAVSATILAILAIGFNRYIRHAAYPLYW